ncbi:hypothetical protein [Periweissella fabalis]|uniref:YtxH domain-containing protein n=1 Tax=Periweissella fabalis TaxID=1070421 RepID=A0A7X6N2M4_9LACO|nr:hypothetical protein [Periweissella fabalis]MCM0598531.1 YtxH domain-containing protein [Periweissella fabalis]NKZ24187.1 hypothetical protein [Periweissella fabalis]
MGKKLGLLTGLAISGAAAFAAFKALTPQKQEKLIKDARAKIDDLRDNAIDYAYYATDFVEDMREQLEKRKQEDGHYSDMVTKSQELAGKAKEKAHDVVSDVKEKISGREAIEPTLENDDIDLELSAEDVAKKPTLPTTSDVKAVFKDVKVEVLKPRQSDSEK